MNIHELYHTVRTKQRRIQDFKLGGGGALKKIAPSGGRRENCWGISCEKSRFCVKKIIFPPPPPPDPPLQTVLVDQIGHGLYFN